MSNEENIYYYIYVDRLIYLYIYNMEVRNISLVIKEFF